MFIQFKQAQSLRLSCSTGKTGIRSSRDCSLEFETDLPPGSLLFVILLLLLISAVIDITLKNCCDDNDHGSTSVISTFGFRNSGLPFKCL